MTVINDVKYVRELLEKDMLYLKEKICNVEKKLDTRLLHLEVQTEHNSEFRKKFKWTASFIVTLASVVSFALMLLSYKMKWLGR